PDCRYLALEVLSGDPEAFTTATRHVLQGAGPPTGVVVIDLARTNEVVFTGLLGHPVGRAVFDGSSRYLAVRGLAPAAAARFLQLFTRQKARIVDLEAKAEVAAFDINHLGPVVSFGFSGDGRHILTAAPDTSLALVRLFPLAMAGSGPPDLEFGLTVQRTLWKPDDLIAQTLDALPP